MDVWFALFAREFLLVAVCTIVGLGPVALLYPSLDRATRLALAPAFGLALSVCVLVTALYRVPAYKGWPLVPAMMVASLAMAVVLARRGRVGEISRMPLPIPRREAAQLLVVTVVVLGTLTLPMALLNSTGPAGGYHIADAAGYVAEIDGAQRQSVHGAELQRPPWQDLTIQYWSSMSRGYQQIGFDAVAAYTNEAVGLHATDTHSAFLLGLILIGALAAWAVVRQVTGTRSWAAVFAAVLFAGPFFRTLFMDGSQAAISGIVLVLPTMLAAWLALRHRRFRDVCAFAVMAAGLQTLYPLFVPPVVIAGAIVLAVLAVGYVRRAGFSLAQSGRAVAMVIGAVALAAVISPVAFERNVRYWKTILEGGLSYAGLPPYDLPPLVVPSWLLQTRELYFLPHLGGQPFSQLLVSVALPAVLVAVIAYGLWRHRVAWAGVAVIVAAAVLANRTATAENCSYCAQRNLLVVAPVAMVLLGVGLAAMRARRGVTAVLAMAVGAVALVAVANMARHPALRLMYGSYVFDEQINTVLRQLPDQRGPVQVEGFGQTFEAPMNDPLAYHRVNEVTAAPVSLAMETDDTKGLAYLGGPRPIGLEFRPDYRYVLTRLPDIRVPTRRVIARSGPVALQERTGNLDVTLNSGTFAPQAWQHDAGTAWVQSGVPVNFWVIGGVSRTVWLRVTLRASVPLKAAGASVTALRQGRTVFVCMPVQGPPPVRRADMYFTFEGHPPPSLKNEYALPYPTSGVKLVEMRVDYRPCR